MPPSFLLAPPPDFQTFLRPRLVCQGVCLLSPFQPCESPVVVVTKKPRLVHKWLWSSWSNFQASKKNHLINCLPDCPLDCAKNCHTYSPASNLLLFQILSHMFSEIMSKILTKYWPKYCFKHWPKYLKNLPKIAFKTPRKLTRSTNPFSNDFQLSPERSHRFWMLK